MPILPFSFARLHTLCRIKILNLAGKRITVGARTVISRHADLACHKRNAIVVGDDCYISSHTILNAANGPITIGNKTSVGPLCIVHGNCVLGGAIRIGSHVAIVPGNHNYSKKDVLIKNQGETSLGIKVGDDVWIGAGVQVLDGADIGQGCVIGAGSVVKGSLEPYGVFVGAPARKVKART